VALLTFLVRAELLLARLAELYLLTGKLVDVQSVRELFVVTFLSFEFATAAVIGRSGRVIRA